MNSLVPACEHDSASLGLPAYVSSLSPEDRQALQRAMRDLESTSFAIRLCAILGRRASALASAVPPHLAEIANKTAEAAIRASLSLALRSLAGKPLADTRRIHKAAAALTGAAGGAFGISTLVLELPVSTTIMLRSIADIARAEGHDLSDPKAALACVEVFAIGARAGGSPEPPFLERSSDQDLGLREAAGLETGYFALRAVLAKSVSEAVGYLTGRSIVSEAAPGLVRFIAQIASRFGMAISQKLLAQSVPLIGAAGGAAINYVFTDHFQTVARGHFTVLRLERRYGASVIRAEYEQMLRRA